MTSRRQRDVAETLSMASYSGICLDCGEYSECLSQVFGMCPNCHRLDDPDVYRDKLY